MIISVELFGFVIVRGVIVKEVRYKAEETGV